MMASCLKKKSNGPRNSAATHRWEEGLEGTSIIGKYLEELGASLVNTSLPAPMPAHHEFLALIIDSPAT
jgi:hypothetical protein